MDHEPKTYFCEFGWATEEEEESQADIKIKKIIRVLITTSDLWSIQTRILAFFFFFTFWKMINNVPPH